MARGQSRDVAAIDFHWRPISVHQRFPSTRSTNDFQVAEHQGVPLGRWYVDYGGGGRVAWVSTHARKSWTHHHASEREFRNKWGHPPSPGIAGHLDRDACPLRAPLAMSNVPGEAAPSPSNVERPTSNVQLRTEQANGEQHTPPLPHSPTPLLALPRGSLRSSLQRPSPRSGVLKPRKRRLKIAHGASRGESDALAQESPGRGAGSGPPSTEVRKRCQEPFLENGSGHLFVSPYNEERLLCCQVRMRGNRVEYGIRPNAGRGLRCGFGKGVRHVSGTVS